MLFPTLEKAVGTANNHRLNRLDTVRKEQGDKDIHTVLKFTLVTPKKKATYISCAVSWINPKHHSSMVFAGADFSLTLIMVYDEMSGGYNITKRMRDYVAAYEKAVTAYLKTLQQPKTSKSKTMHERAPGPTRAPVRTMDDQ